MLVTFADSKSALRVMDIDGAKVRFSQIYNNNFITNFSKVFTENEVLEFLPKWSSIISKKVSAHKVLNFHSC